ATAHALARTTEARVTLLEREAAFGQHASGKNAALCRQLIEHDEYTAFTVRGAQFLRKPPADFADTPLLLPTGSLLAVSSPKSLDTLLARARAFGLPCGALSAPEVLERWPRLAGMPLCGAAHFPTDGVIDIHALLHGYVRGARRDGAILRTDCGVTRVTRGDSGFEIDAGGETWRARVLVNAAGAWGVAVGELAAAMRQRLTPMRRHLFATDHTKDVANDTPYVWHVDEPFYVRPESGGLLLSGCDEVEHPPSAVAVAADAHDALAARLAQVAPLLLDVPVKRSWACLRTFLPDRLPRVAWDERVRGLLWVVGLGGQGATASFAIGERAALAVRAFFA
ncbi:MAG: FAD-dependent oxidoreductase, partial [Chloroflexota bacterium]